MGISASRAGYYRQEEDRENTDIFFEEGLYRRREPSVSPDGFVAPAPPTHYLLSSAVEIVTRQRVAEQLENLLLNSDIYHSNGDVEDVGTTANQEQFFHTLPSHLRLSRNRFAPLQQDVREIIDRNQYNNNLQFSSLYELFAYLLQSNELRLKESLEDFATPMLNDMSSSSSDDDSDVPLTTNYMEPSKKTFLSPWDTADEVWHMNEAELQQLLICQKSLVNLLVDIRARSFAGSYCAKCTPNLSPVVSNDLSEKLRRRLKRAADDLNDSYQTDGSNRETRAEKSRHVLITGRLITQIYDLNRRLFRPQSDANNAFGHRASLVHFLRARELGIAADYRRLDCGRQSSVGTTLAQPKRKSTRSAAKAAVKSVKVLPRKLEIEPPVEASANRAALRGPRGQSHPEMPCRSRFYQSGFTAAEKAMMSNDYLPNQMRIVDSIKSKTFCVSFVGDGTELITASQDHRIRRYVVGGRHQRYNLRETLVVPYVGWSIIDMAVSPDGRHLIYSTWNEPIYQYDFQQPDDGWKPLRIDIQSARYAFFSLRFSVDGREIVAGANDNKIFIYDREASKCVLSMPAHEDDVNAVCFGDTAGHLILTAGDDGLCKASHRNCDTSLNISNKLFISLQFSVWDRRTIGDMFGPHPIGTFAGHRDGISFIDSRGDDRYVLTNSKDQTIKLWDMRVFASEKTINATRTAVSNQDWDYRYNTPYSSVGARKSLEGDCSVATLQGHYVLHTLVRARFSPEHTGRRYVYTGCARGNCIVYDLLTGETAKIYSGHASVVRDCMWHPHRNEIVTSSWDGRTYIWRYDQRRSTSPQTVKAHISGKNGTEIDSEDSCDENYQPIRRRCVVPAYMDRLQRIAQCQLPLSHYINPVLFRSL